MDPGNVSLALMLTVVQMWAGLCTELPRAASGHQRGKHGAVAPVAPIGARGSERHCRRHPVFSAGLASGAATREDKLVSVAAVSYTHLTLPTKA